MALQILQTPRTLLPARVPVLASPNFAPPLRQGVRHLPLLVDDEGPEDEKPAKSRYAGSSLEAIFSRQLKKERKLREKKERKSRKAVRK